LPGLSAFAALKPAEAMRDAADGWTGSGPRLDFNNKFFLINSLHAPISISRQIHRDPSRLAWNHIVRQQPPALAFG
jgi:hypothetical protein